MRKVEIMTNEELGHLFREYKRVCEDLNTHDINIVEGLNQLNGVGSYLAILSRVPGTETPSPHLNKVQALVQEFRMVEGLLKNKGELETRLASTGYRSYIQPTPMTDWSVVFPEQDSA